ncbi:hypothetical protein HWV00_16710 [Moritella sp. 24]|uniref:hypothetical protein n=1 Tax=Moritella sp. 24 TaxID=2746230 RepID=UPI001BA4A327|nr:hypothetical protein [Moritella sp. 24]QUM77729.1 hypothetical protein HWV00_16710 [Moritella sp. 24]
MAVSNKVKGSLLAAGMVMLAGCGSDSSSGTGSTKPTPPTPTIPTAKITFTPTVLATLPVDMSIASDAGFTRYSELLIKSPTSTFNAAVPQLKLRIIATGDNADNDEKIIRAGNIMFHLLQDVANSNYGKDKYSIAQTMATREATLILTKDQDENDMATLKLYAAAAIKLDLLRGILIESGISGIRVDNLANFVADVRELEEEDRENVIGALVQLNSHAAMPKWLTNSQALQFRELSVEGDCHYMSDFAQVFIWDENEGENRPTSKYCTDLGENSDRDAGFEEILHLIQAQGIAPNPETSAYQEAVRARAEAIYKSTAADKPWNPTKDDWADWASDDVISIMGPTYSHEYLAAVLEAFMGMNGHKTEGLDGYTSTEREQIIVKDNIGDDFVREMFAGDLQYTARIQTDGVIQYYNKTALTGTPTFKMKKSDDALEKYTFKSQYLKNAKIVGSDAIDLQGNDKDNILEGNKANNTIRAGAGGDTYIITNTTAAEFSSCQVTSGDDSGEIYTQITCPNTGTDKLYNVETIKLSDAIKTIDAAGKVN